MAADSYAFLVEEFLHHATAGTYLLRRKSGSDLFLNVHMEIVRILWIINFFFFLLVLIFLWSKIYLATKKINELSAIIKSSSEIPDVSREIPTSSTEVKK